MPFGISQNEKEVTGRHRTLQRMYSFMNADKVKDPILLIHGNG
jgi:dipeptidyl aminopeptidase/acylaminoacyl peptidase